MMHGRLRSDTPTMIPASELPFREEWRLIANALPRGAVLFVVPEGETASKQSMPRLAARVRSQGRPIYARCPRSTSHGTVVTQDRR